jgi:hypothetical protein
MVIGLLLPMLILVAVRGMSFSVMVVPATTLRALTAMFGVLGQDNRYFDRLDEYPIYLIIFRNTEFIR